MQRLAVDAAAAAKNRNRLPEPVQAQDSRPRGASVVVFTGAGISTPSGIPDFRSEGGVWDLFDPQEFTIHRFHADPGAFWDRRARLVEAMRILDAEPNVAHLGLADAVKDGRVDHVITQNVDGLQTKAGTPAGRLLELHGNGGRTRCLSCGSTRPVQETLASRREGEAPRCPCSGLVKPDVVLFGEPVLRMADAVDLVASSTRLIVVGTSLQVYPAAGLVDVALQARAEIVICNRDATSYDRFAHVCRGDVVDSIVQQLARLPQ